MDEDLDFKRVIKNRRKIIAGREIVITTLKKKFG